MAKSLTLGSIVSVFLLCHLSYAQAVTLKVGFVDLQKAMHETKAGKAAAVQLEKEVAAKRAEVEKSQATLQKEAEQLEKNSGILSEKKRAEQYTELQKKFGKFQQLANESQIKLQQRQAELTKPLVDELRAMIEGIGREGGYNLVVEKNEGAVLYAQNGTDLTAELIKRFDAKRKK